MQLTFFEWNFTSNRCSIFPSFLRLWVLLLFHVVLPGMGMAIFSGNWSNLASHRTKRQSYFVWVTGSWLMAAHVGRVKKVWGEDAEIPQTKYCTKSHRACQNTKKRWRLRQPWPTHFLWLKHGWKMMNMQKKPTLYRCSCTWGKRGLHWGIDASLTTFLHGTFGFRFLNGEKHFFQKRSTSH